MLEKLAAMSLASAGSTGRLSVLALICGLSGLVERLDWDGLPIIISGAGGKTPTTVNNPPSPRSRFAKGGETAYWEATVNKLSVEFVCKSKTGAILDRYFQPV